MDKVRLDLVGITYNQIESGVYAVILQESGGQRRIPIVIGFPEAQSIECKLQEVSTPRPLTHDLMANILSAFGVTLLEVDIHRLDNGVFAAELVLDNGDSLRIVDSRSSDAIALAIRVGAPIYTTQSVLEESGFDPSEKSGEKTRRGTKPVKGLPLSDAKEDFAALSDEDLYEAMQKAAEEENYEEASRLKAEIAKRKNKS